MKKRLALALVALMLVGCVPQMAWAEPTPLLWVPTVLNGSTIYPEDDCFVAQEINEQFDVKITVQKTSSQTASEMALMYASGTIPDVNPIFPANFAQYYDQGLFRDIPLDMLQEYAPTYYAFSSALVDYDRMAVTREGKLYGLPHTTDPPQSLSVIRTDWLQAVGLEMPATLEEFEEVARAFATEDPDGNGANDTYLLSWGPEWASNFQWISAAFGLETDWLEEDGVLYDKRVSENYKQYLLYVQNLNRQGYVFPDLTLPKKDNVTELLTTGAVGYQTDSFTWFMPLYRPSAYYARMFEQNANATAAYVPPLIGTDGEQSTMLEGTPVWMYTCIGRNTTDEQLIKILQILEKQCADDTFHNLIWRGVEGEHFVYNDDGMAIYTDAYQVLDEQQKAGFKTFFINIRIGEQLVYSYGKEAGVQRAFIEEQYAPAERAKMPIDVYNEAKLEYGADVEALEKEFFMRALSGQADIEAEWDSYVKSMNDAGLEAIMAEYNETYQDWQ